VYKPSRHFWIVGNKPGKVFSSALPGYVDVSDSDYAAWRAENENQATSILTDGELADVLVKAEAPNATVTAAGASDFGGVPPAEALAIVQAIGAQVSSTAQPALNATYELSGPSWEDMRSEAQYIATFGAFSGGLITLPWTSRSGAVSFTKTDDFLAVVRGLADYLAGWTRHFSAGAAAPKLGEISVA